MKSVSRRTRVPRVARLCCTRTIGPAGVRRHTIHGRAAGMVFVWAYLSNSRLKLCVYIYSIVYINNLKKNYLKRRSCKTVLQESKYYENSRSQIDKLLIYFIDYYLNNILYVIFHPIVFFFTSFTRAGFAFKHLIHSFRSAS